MIDAKRIVNELVQSVSLISVAEADRLIALIGQSRKIFLAGAGRSGLMGKAFAMRLMHLGIATYVVGETITPAIAEGDLLIIGSGSGETKSLVSMAHKARSVGAALAVVTIHPESTLGSLADVAVKLPGTPKDKTEAEYGTIQPMASLFEQTLLIFYDSIVIRLMDKQRSDSGRMFLNHANLE
ncbi:6-phospho-3-hexuloisomerase [Cohnella cholangitidis]|uniref:6-phospho-3-hexuloisomerase n=1 Tax=Cohnella cholangitidis TaxID=2598458 RepID=A0A7G5C6D2_9BACL|nr:6-phospho-3-hexuloisomerase [Cohnella cholangitidis]QMV44766.1 6-phospho-3-hexuloisomerase [Cohnella cholangitidis]